MGTGKTSREQSDAHAQTVSAADSMPAAPRPTSAWDTPIDPAAYEDRALLSQGGMGKVFVARDRRLGRKVAIKELRAANEAGRARFQREALLTARLEHPGIVSIHEAGCWPDGEPFYAMRLVPGRSLDEALRGATTVPARLALVPHVIAMAEALAYAHDQGVIHRDLKPHNVMIGEFGETVVIDWGLAKDLRAGSLGDAVSGERTISGSDAETVDGSVLGTPAYMPPEQARGEPVDERADVYAIGAVLYHVLAGQAPYQGARSEQVLAAVLRGAPPALATRAPEVPADLIAIVERAMARVPGDRYATGRALAEDLRRFQTGQLVGAHRYSTAALVRRWLRRHKAPVAVAAIALAAMAVLGVIAVARIVDERAAAQHQRAVAEARRADADHLVEFMLKDLGGKLDDVDRLDLLEPVAVEAIAYYDRVLDADGQVAAGPFMAHRRLGDVLFLKNDLPGAEREMTIALGIIEARAAAAPDDLRVRHDVSVMHNRLGDVKFARGDTDGALAAYRRALALVEALPDAEGHRASIGYTRRRIGRILEQRAELDGALAEYRAALAIADAALAATPADPALQEDAATSHELIGDILLRRGDVAGALVEFDAARATWIALAAAQPGGKRERSVEVAWSKLGDAEHARGELGKALAAYEQMLAIAERLAARDPDNAMWQRDLGIALVEVADVRRDRGELALAMPLYERSLAQRERLLAAAPDNARNRMDVALAHDRIGTIDQNEDRLDAALAHFRAGHELRLAIAAGDPDDAEVQRSLAVGHTKLANVLRRLKRLDEAEAEARAALAIMQRLASLDATSQRSRRDVSVAHHALGKILTARGDLAGADEQFRADLAIAQALATEHPDNPARQFDLAESHAQVGELAVARKDTAGARASYEQAMTILDAVIALHPDNADYKERRAQVAEALATLK